MRSAIVAGVLVLALVSLAGGQVVVNPRIQINDSIDCSSAAEVVKQIIKPGMTDEQKAVACWRFMLGHFYHWFPPYEDSSPEPVRDFAKAINSYGFSPCFGNAPVLTDLWEACGFKTRSWTLTGHSIPEVFYGDAWHMLDADARAIHRKADGQIASVVELAGDPKLFTEASAKSDPFYPFGAPDTDVSPLIPWGPPSKMMDLYAAKKNHCCYNKRAVAGHAMYLALRQGETLTLSPENQGVWLRFDKLPKDLTWKWKVTPQAPEKLVKFDAGPADVSGKLTYGAGTLNWAPDFKKIKQADLLWMGSQNAQLKDGTIVAADASKPAVAVLRVYCPWVLLAADLSIDAASTEAPTADVSTDGGRSWFAPARSAAGGNAWDVLKPTPAAGPSGTPDAAKAKAAVGCYEYLVRVTLKNGAINSLKINNTFQVAQLSLPTLKPGKNTVKVYRGPDEGVVSFVASDQGAAKKEVIFQTKGLVLDGKLPLAAAKPDEPGNVVYKLTAPDALRAISIGALVSISKGPLPFVQAEYSLDAGATWKQAWKLEKNANPENNWFEEDARVELPDNASKEALFRFTIAGDSEHGKGKQFGGISAVRCYGYYKLPQPAGVRLMADINWVETAGDARAEQGLHQLVDKFPTEFTVECAGQQVKLKSITFSQAE